MVAARRLTREFKAPVIGSLWLRDRALEAIGEGVVITEVVRPDFPIVYVNPGFELITGYSFAEAAGRNCRFLQGVGTDPAVVTQLREAIAAGLEFRGRLLNYRRDGVPFMNELRLFPLRDAGGFITHYVGVQFDVTEQVRTLEALTASEERYRALVTASASLLWGADPKGAVTSALGWAEYAGQSEADYLGYGWLDAVHPDDRPGAVEVLRDARARAVPIELHCRVRRADGQYRWADLRGAVLRNGDGTVREWVGTLTDIHEHRTAQEALARSEERQRLATEATGLGTYSIELATNRREWSNEMWALLGLAPGTPASREEYCSVLHPADRDQADAAFEQRCAQVSGPVQTHYRIVRPDTGEVRWISEFSRTIADEAGCPVRLVGTIRDVTAAKEAELALKDSEARYRLLADTAIDMIVRTGLDGIRTYMSPASRELLGYEPEEMVGTSALEAAHPDDRDGVGRDMARFLSGEADRQTATYRVLHRDGRWVWLEAHRRLVRDASGAPVEAVSVVRDITERHKLEEQLRQAQKMEAVGQLTGGIAHDFNNLLTIVLGNAEILTEALAGSGLKDLAAQIQAAAERGSDLNQKLLAFSRRQSLRPKAVRLDRVVDEIATLLRRALGEQIALRLALAPPRAVAVVDRAQLESALLNLAVNARDAMPLGGTLTIEDEEVVTSDGSVEYIGLTVGDTGSGMPPEVLERVFEPFFTTKEVGKGSGLGLSMVQGFVEQSGGHVTIRSRVGEGTSVTILLPAVEERDAMDAADPASKEAAAGRGKVLVVEDEADVRRYVTTTLIGLGYEVLEAPDARAGLELLRKDPGIDLLFSDVVLPQGVSGFELVRRARAMNPAIKVLLTSGYPEEAFEAHGKRDADLPLLNKPYRRRELAEALRGVMQAGAVEPAPDRATGEVV